MYDNLCDLSAPDKLDGMLDKARRAVGIARDAGDDRPAIGRGIEMVEGLIARRTRETI